MACALVRSVVRTMVRPWGPYLGRLGFWAYLWQRSANSHDSATDPHIWGFSFSNSSLSYATGFC